MTDEKTATSIIIPAYNQVDCCRQCVHSIQANTRAGYRLILVDNGSTDGAGEFFDSVPGADVIHAGENLGFAGGVNLGLKRHLDSAPRGGEPGNVCLLNSDTIVPEGWLTRLEDALSQANDIGMVGPRSNCVSGSQRVEGPELTDMAGIDSFADELARERSGELRDVARLVGFCLLIRGSVLQEVGFFDEAFGIGNFEDDDYCVRVLRAGYRLCVAEDTFVFHYGGQTFLGMGMTEGKWRALIEDNQRRFEAKWPFSPRERLDTVQESKQINRRARDAFERADFKGALRLLKRAVEICPILETNYNDLGVVLWALGDTDRALEQFARAVRLNPEYVEARENLRDAARTLDRVDEVQDLLA